MQYSVDADFGATPHRKIVVFLHSRSKFSLFPTPRYPYRIGKSLERIYFFFQIVIPQANDNVENKISFGMFSFVGTLKMDQRTL